MNNSQEKYTTISFEKNVINSEYEIKVKKFVDWCCEIYAYNFYRENKTTNVLLVVEI